MKIELIKYYDESTSLWWWKITKDTYFISCYRTEQEGIEAFDKYVARLQEPKQEPEIIKSVTI